MSGDFLTITAEERALIEYLRTQPDGVERLRNSILSSGEPGVTHGAPWTSDRLTPCCHRTPFELPMSDRLTCHPSRVTCHTAEPT